MSAKNKKQFGIWMDSHHATIAGRENIDNGDFIILNQVKNQDADNHSNDTASKFFKEIVVKIPNIDEIHVTGTGQVQEQFIKFLADTAQYKNVVSTESTSNKMSDEQLIAFITTHFN